MLFCVEQTLALLRIAEIPRFFTAVDLLSATGTIERCIELRSRESGVSLFPDHFPRRRAENCFRIFWVGDSALDPRPYGEVSSSPRRLEARLRAMFGVDRVEVIACVAPLHHSAQIADLCGELAQDGADLLIVSLGHDEFLEDEGSFGSKVFATIRGCRTGRWLLGAVSAGSRPVKALGGAGPEPEGFTDQAPRRFDDLSRLRRSLQRIVAGAALRGCPVMFCLPVGDLLDQEPFLSVFDASTSGRQRAQIVQDLATSRLLKSEGHPSEALAVLDSLALLSPSTALIAYERARILEELGEHQKALELFVLARDLDQRPARAGSTILDHIRSFARDCGAILADPEPLLFTKARGGVFCSERFLDHVHLDCRGQSLVVSAVLKAMADHGLIERTHRWNFARDLDFEDESRALSIDPIELHRALAEQCLNDLPHLIRHHLEPDRWLGSVLETALKDDPAHVPSLVATGIHRWLQGDDDQSMPFLCKALEVDEESARRILLELCESCPGLSERLEYLGIRLSCDSTASSEGW